MDKKPWIQNYPAGVPENVQIDPHTTLVDLFENAFSKYANSPMIENMGKLLKYRDVDALSKDFASYIQNYTNLVPGDRVAIQMPNLLQYPISIIGLIRAGMVVININPLYTAHEMEQQISDAKVKAIVILENFANKLAIVLKKTNIDNVIVTKVGDMLSPVKGFFVNFTLRYIKRLVPEYTIKHSISFKKAIELGSKKEYVRCSPSSSSIAFIQYTGGTTGVSKGAMLSHGNVISNIDQARAWLCNKLQDGKEIIVTALPLYHIFALTGNLLTMIKLGAHNVLVTNPRNVKSFIQDLKRRRFTCLFGVSTLFNAIISNKSVSKIDFSGLKVSMAGGMSISTKVAQQWEKLTKNPIIETYGLTEASPAVIGNPFNGKHRPGTVGLPIPNTNIKIVDDKDEEVPYGVSGNLLVKGPQIMQGYWCNPKETENVLKDGWLVTGDVAVMDEGGFIKIVDRKKDMINVSGFNVYPSEIEAVVELHPKVKEVAAIGLPYDDFRDIVKLFIVKKDDSLTEQEVLNYCKNYLTGYKMPKAIEFRKELPKSNLGKVLKRVLREEAQSTDVSRS